MSEGSWIRKVFDEGATPVVGINCARPRLRVTRIFPDIILY